VPDYIHYHGCVGVGDYNFCLQGDFMNAALIGCGSIGGYKPDTVENESTGIISHGHAIAVHMEPVVCFDPEKDKRNYVKNKWGFSEAKEDFREYNFSDIDFVALATPAGSHLTHFYLLAEQMQGKTVLLEKPAGNCLPDVRKIAEIADKNNIKMAVNYQRNYLSAYSREFLETMIGPASTWKFVLHYCRGYHREASHFFALLSAWKIPVPAFRLFGGIPDFSEQDLTFDAVSDRFHLVAHDGSLADVFQIEIYGIDGRVLFVDHGRLLEVSYTRKEETFGDYFSWGRVPDFTVRTGLETGLAYVYSAITDGNDVCTIGDALNVWEMMANGRKK
jgi:hypothetical protein